MGNLLVEYRILEGVKVIRESSNGVKKLKIRGKFQKCDEQNNNGRIYPRKVLESQVKELQEKVSERSLVGALDHPLNDGIQLAQASHLITKLHVESNGDVIGEAEILSTPSGKIVEALINDGVKIGISSRGLGTVSEGKAGKIVNEDFKLITFDLVSDPSTKGAYPELTESVRLNSEKAQKIVNKLKQEQVLMTVLTNKINEALVSRKAVVPVKPLKETKTYNKLKEVAKTVVKKDPTLADIVNSLNESTSTDEKKAIKNYLITHLNDIFYHRPYKPLSVGESPQDPDTEKLEFFEKLIKAIKKI